MRQLGIVFLLFLIALHPQTALFGEQQNSGSDEIHVSSLISLTPIIQDLISLARKQAQNREEKIPVIGIGGCPGVGKTTFTRLLSLELQNNGVSYAILHFDDWTNPIRSRQSGYFDLEGVHVFFSLLLEGYECLEKPTFNPSTDEHSKEIVDLRAVDLIFFEGLLALSEKESMNYLRYCDRGIYLDANEQDIWQWKRVRPDMKKLSDEEFAKHMRAVLKRYHENIEPFKSKATWIVHKDASHNYSLSSN